MDILPKGDALSILLEKANNDSLSYEIRHSSAENALSIISKENNDSINRVNHFKIANRYFNMNALEDYKKVTEKIIINSIRSNDSTALAKAYSYKGDYFGKKFKSDSAYSYYTKSEKIYRKLKKNSSIAKTLLNKAIIQSNENDYVGSEKSAINALKFLKRSDDDDMLFEANNTLSVIYVDLKEFDKSLDYQKNALRIANNKTLNTDLHAKATSLNNLGLAYREMNQHFKAINCYETALKESGLFYDNPSLFATLKDNLAYSKFKTGDYENLPILFYESLKIRDSLKIVPGQIMSNLNLSKYFAFKKDTLQSIDFAERSYFLAKSNKMPKDLLTTIEQLSSVDPKNAPKYSKEYFKINDSLQIADRQIRNKFARIEFETDELALEKNNLIEQRKTLIYIALGIILIGVFIFVIRFQAAKNRELLLVQEQQRANEEVYQLMLNQQNKIEEVRQLEKKRIAQELHDGVLGKLFGTRMNLGVLNRKKGEEAEGERDVYIDELKTLEQEIREISHDLNTEKTAVFNNFVLMVTTFIETQRKISKASITLKVAPEIEWNHIENMAKINFYRILQEAFQNINKHANAKTVSVTFSQDERHIKLDVKDDGIGFAYAKKKKGIGLLNMNARISDSGGVMVVETIPENGTLLHFEIPTHP